MVFFIARQQHPPAFTDIELVDSNNNKIRLAELKGSVVFVNFWATWCEPCVDELPSIENLFRKMSVNSKFKMITILFKDSERNALSYMKINGYTFPVYLNPDSSAAKFFGVTGVPETYIIDKNGILREKVIGPAEWDTPIVVEALLKLVDEK